MKKILFIISIALIIGAPLRAQFPTGRAYPGGIYVFCGKELPRYFYYSVEKKDASGNWKKVAELRAPQNEAELKANLLKLPASIRESMPLPVERSASLWTLISKSLTADSLYVYAADPKIMSVVGCGWFDDGLSTPGTYQYRVSKVTSKETEVLSEVSQRFPENSYTGTLEILQFTPRGAEIALYYGLSDTTTTSVLKLYRGHLQEKDYHETPSTTSYTTLNGRTVALVRDNSVIKGMAYSYVAVPYDVIGNKGTPSDTINVYNITNITDIGIATKLHAVADKATGGVTVNWEFSTEANAQRYELYRSKDFDGDYERIATLPSDVKTYIDRDIDPAEVYYYFVVMHNGFGSSVPSARAPVILEGDKSNFLPPQNLTASLQGNQVHLSFGSSEEPETRSYQVYRGEGFTGPVSLIASIESPDSIVHYVDTLPPSVTPKTYSYAVADVNSSYHISPLSERASIQYSGGMLPVPSRVTAQLRGDEILVVWDDMSKQNIAVAGYNVWRSIVDGKGQTIEAPAIVATPAYYQNNYIDTQIVPGKHYRYALESFDVNGEKSSQSLHVGIAVPAQPPLAPGQVSAFASADRVLLRWDNPADPSVASIRVYRATQNAAAVKLQDLPADKDTYEDKTAQKGEQYFYYVVTVNTRNEESRSDSPVSAKIRK